MDYIKTGLFIVLVFAIILSGCTQANAPPSDDGQNGTSNQIEQPPLQPAGETSPDGQPGEGSEPTPPETAPEQQGNETQTPPSEETGESPPATDEQHNDTATETPADEPSEQPPAEPPAGENGTAANVKEFDVTAKNWEFVPATITVSKGDTVRLHITSIDVEHGFVLSAFVVNENLKKGETVDVEFVAGRAGSFLFFCNVFCGQGHSTMKGTLIVNE